MHQISFQVYISFFIDIFTNIETNTSHKTVDSILIYPDAIACGVVSSAQPAKSELGLRFDIPIIFQIVFAPIFRAYR